MLGNDGHGCRLIQREDVQDKGYGAAISETLTGEGGGPGQAANRFFFQPIYLAIIFAATVYFTLYKDSFKLVASKNIDLMKESGNLPSADTGRSTP